MSFSRISNSSDLLTAFSRVLPAVNAPFGEMQCTRYAAMHRNRTNNLHVTSVRRYPNPPALPLPTNVSEIFANETGRFTPERARDIAVPVLLYNKSDCKTFFSEQPSKMTETSNSSETYEDTCVDSYDCFGAVSLNSTMQSNVPKPYSSNGKSTHLNMPGGQWARDGKYIAEDMQKSHYRSVRSPQLKLDKRELFLHTVRGCKQLKDKRKNDNVILSLTHCTLPEHFENMTMHITGKTNSQEIVICHSGLANYVSTNILLQTMYPHKYIYCMGYATNAPQVVNTKNDSDKKESVLFSKKERFRRIVRDYGITVTVFHITISLMSLGACYAAVLSGVDLEPMIQFIISEDSQVKEILTNSSTFLLAYGVHKVMAPVRIAITCACAPILVRRLRKMGILKPPKI